jgi:prepilin peptidase CpaA
MVSIYNTIAALEISLLLYGAVTDVAARLIPNAVCLILAVLAMFRLPFGDVHQLVLSLVSTTVLFPVLFGFFIRGYIGGGDVKLLTAFAIGLSASQVIELLAATALAGGVLAMVHLLLRGLPHPAPAPVGSSRVRRIYAIERWRNLRRAPLPYGVAIACGGIWIVLTQGV